MKFNFIIKLAYTLINCHLILTTSNHRLQIGAGCDGKWICSALENCLTMNIPIAKPEVCSFTHDNRPIMCCPPPPSTYVHQIVAGKCQKYEEECENCKKSELQKKVNGQGISGTVRDPRIHSYMVLMGYGELNSVKWICRGSIISHHFILSAAHCAEISTGQQARWIRVGSIDIYKDEGNANVETVEIKQRIVHPDYKPPEVYNDIAVFRLKIPLTFNAWIGPVCVATDLRTHRTYATLTGWRDTATGGKLSSQLISVNVPIINGNSCKRLLGNTREIPRGINTASMMCAGYLNGGKNACMGESGNPLVIDSDTSYLKTQIGISLKRSCDHVNTPSVYTRIYHYLPWIQSIVWP